MGSSVLVLLAFLHSKKMRYLDATGLHGAVGDFFPHFVAVFLLASNFSWNGGGDADDPSLYDAKKREAILVYQDIE